MSGPHQPRRRGDGLLGYSGPGFALPTYTRLLPSNETRTRKVIDDAFTEAQAKDDGEPPGGQGTSAPPAKPMCPQCALAARRPHPAHDKGGVRKPRPLPAEPQLRATPGNKADAPPHATDG